MKISVFGDDGSEKILGYHLRNSLFGLDCLIGNCDASVTAVAITDVVLSRLRHEEIKDLIVEDPAVGIALSNYYCRVLRLMCFQAENQCFYDVLTRVANFLYLHLSNEHDFKEKKTLNVTEQELAALVASSRVHVCRVLKRLREAGIINTARGKIVVNESMILEDYSSCVASDGRKQMEPGRCRSARPGLENNLSQIETVLTVNCAHRLGS